MWIPTFRCPPARPGAARRPAPGGAAPGSVLAGAALLAAALAGGCTQLDAPIDPPVAEVDSMEMTIHDDTRIDPYFWLRERETPEVIAYLEPATAARPGATSGTGPWRSSTRS